MLDAGARIVSDAEKCLPRTQWAERNIDTAYQISAPVPNLEETCYYPELKSPKISLINEKIGKKFTVSYSGETLPHFLAWKSMASGDYAVGLEPCTTKLDHLFEYSTIASGESICFTVDLSVSELD